MISARAGVPIRSNCRSNRAETNDKLACRLNFSGYFCAKALLRPKPTQRAIATSPQHRERVKKIFKKAFCAAVW